MADITYVRPWLYEKQTDAFFNDHRYAVTEASTKAGKTVGAMAWLNEQAITLGGENRHFWWVAPIYRQAKIAYNRFKSGLEPGTFAKNDTDVTITLNYPDAPFHGAILEFKGAEDPDTLYGEDVFACVMDEYTRCRKESFFAVRSTLTHTRGKMRLIGNVKGRGWGYHIARAAEAGKKDWNYTKITCWDAVEAGILQREEIEDAKANLPENVFNELYLCIPADDGGNPFGLDAIARQIVDGMSDKDPVCWGWDLAKAHDWTVGIALDEDGYVCRFERWQMDWNDAMARIVSLTNGVEALVDSTGLGDPILSMLDKESPVTFSGLKFSNSSKQQLMEGLAVAIQRGQIWYPRGNRSFPDQIVNELEAFEYQLLEKSGGVRYAAPLGYHDDCVVSLALAVRLFHNRAIGFDRRRVAVAGARPITELYVPR